MNLTGQRFGRLLVESVGTPIPSKTGSQNYKTYVVICDCGNSKTVREIHLKDGNTKSCGCIVKENMSKRNTSHGYSKHVLWDIWHGMNTRCNNPNSSNFLDYGARGIKVCDRWIQKFDGEEGGFLNFVADMLESFNKGLEIDRIDNDGNYSPSNCRWATRKEQTNNRRTTRKLTYNNETCTVTEWSSRFGINYNTLLSRIDVLSWSIEKSLTTPTRKRSK